MNVLHSPVYLFAKRMSEKNEQQIRSSLETLSSGKRINQSSDDPAGLAISTRMTSQIRGNNISSQNIEQTLSLFQTAEGGLSSITSLLQRMRELALYAKNGTFSSSDQKHIQEEFLHLQQEIQHISTSTLFNSRSLLNNSSSLVFNGIDSKVSIGKLSTQQSVTMEAWIKTGETKEEAVVSNRNVNHGGVEFGIKQGKVHVYLSESTGSPAILSNKSINDQKWHHIVWTNDGTTSSIYIDGALDKTQAQKRNNKIQDAYIGYDAALDKATSGSWGKFKGEISSVRIYDRILDANDINGNFNGNITRENMQNEWNFSDPVDDTLKDSIGGNQGVIQGTTPWKNTVSFHTGNGFDDVINTSLVDVSLKALGINGLTINDDESMDKLDAALETVSSNRSKFASYQQALTQRQYALSEQTVQTTQSQSRIEDADMAEVMSHLTKEKILSQSSLSMIVQSSDLSSSFLKLLSSLS